MLELEQAPVDPVPQPTMSQPSIQSGFSATLPTAALPVASAVEIAGLTTTDQYPAFTLGLDNQTVHGADAAIFTVFFKGQPCPSVEWYIDGRLVHASSQMVVGGSDGVEVVEDLERGTSTLTVLSAGRDNEAQYTCRVHNRRGTAVTNAQLFVIGKSLVHNTSLHPSPVAKPSTSFS